MYSRIWTKPSTKSCSEQLGRLKVVLQDCDAVVIGAGSGLSTAAGFTYTGERFEQHFSDFAQKYGIRDMYSGGFYPFATPEEHWAYWSRYIYINRYQDAPKPVYEDLLNLVRDKDYFVITTNVDHCFQKAGFDKKRLFYTQGDYGLFQCSEPCCQETFENETVIREMMERQEDMKIPTELLPVCPRCGKPMTMNLRSDNKFVEDEAQTSKFKIKEGCTFQHNPLNFSSIRNLSYCRKKRFDSLCCFFFINSTVFHKLTLQRWSNKFT